MKRNPLQKFSQAQMAVEYLLLLAVVVSTVMVMLIRFGPRTQYASSLFFNAVTADIVGTEPTTANPNGISLTAAGPVPVDGEWGDWTLCRHTAGCGSSGVSTRVCTPPANGGTPCIGPTEMSCPPPGFDGTWGGVPEGGCTVPYFAEGISGTQTTVPGCVPQGACCDESQRPSPASNGSTPCRYTSPCVVGDLTIFHENCQGTCPGVGIWQTTTFYCNCEGGSDCCCAVNYGNPYCDPCTD